MRKRKVFPGEVHHLYQITKGRGLLFYTVHDYLVFFTLLCSFAKKRGIRILALCPMPNHIHQVVVVENARQLADYVQQTTRLFALEWNRARACKGELFRHPFGSAGKLGAKKARTALAYCNNNPVEKKLCQRAEDYRWTFLAYYRQRNPFSSPLNETRCSARMKYVLKQVKQLSEENNYLRYRQLDWWERILKRKEWLQLCDYIISCWNRIEYEGALAYYGSFSLMLRAFHDNTGSEHEIKEQRDSYSDQVYADCARALLEEGLVKDLRAIPGMSDRKKSACFRLLLQRTQARPRQICQFLHMPID